MIRPWCDQERTSCAAACGPTPGWSSSCGASLRVSALDLACELAFLGGQLQHASGDRAQREQAAAQLGVPSAVGSGCCEALQQPCACERPQLAAQRLRCRDQQVAQLAEPGAFGVDRSLASGHQRLQRLPFTAGSRCRGPLAGEHAAGGADRVERVGLAARAALPPQPADLEHPLAAAGQEARQTGTERAGAFDRERASTRRVLLDELQRLRVAVAVRDHRRLEDDRAALRRARPRARASRGAGRHRRCSPADLRASENRPPAQALGDTTGAGLGMETAGGRTVTGHALQGGQASDQASKRAPGRHRSLRSDTSLERHPQPGSFENRVTNKEHRRQPDKRPRRDSSHTHSSGMSLIAGLFA